MRVSGSTVDAHEEWMPIMIRHELAIVSPWVGNVVLVEDRHQPVDLSEVVNDLTHLCRAIRDDNSHDHLEGSNCAKLRDDCRLELPEMRGCLTVLEAKRMDEIAVNLRTVTRGANVME